FFFFSSRRRHTRSDRDWSSDVCSSDLAYPLPLPPFSIGICKPCGERSKPTPTTAVSGNRSPASSILPAPWSFISPAICSTSWVRSEEHTSDLQARSDLVCRLLLEKKNL